MDIIYTSAAFLSSLLVENGVVKKEDEEIYTFGFECRISTVVQLAVYLLVGLSMNCVGSLACFVLVFTNTKKRIGGWHANRHLTCLLVTTLSSVIPAKMCRHLPRNSFFVIAAFGMGLVFLLAPIPHKNNPKTDAEIITNRRSSLVAVVLMNLVLLILWFFHAELALAGSSGMLISAITLLPIAINKKGVSTWTSRKRRMGL